MTLPLEDEPLPLLPEVEAAAAVRLPTTRPPSVRALEPLVQEVQEGNGPASCTNRPGSPRPPPTLPPSAPRSRAPRP
eukprot:3440888-Heterocapsa_arctica.AAC.1